MRIIGVPLNFPDYPRMSNFNERNGSDCACGTDESNGHVIRNIYQVQQDLFASAEAAGVLNEEGRQFFVTWISHDKFSLSRKTRESPAHFECRILLLVRRPPV